AGRRGVATIDQKMRTGSEIVEHVLLPGEIAGALPSLAESPAATQISDHIHDSAIEERPQVRQEVGLEADAVSAISVKEDGILAVELRAFAPQNGYGHGRAVLGSGVFPDDFDIAVIGGGSFAKCGGRHLPGSGIKAVPGTRLRVADAQKIEAAVGIAR